MKSSMGQATPAKRTRVPRERRMDKNTVARPKRSRAVAWTGPAETVEQFEARGGQVQRVSTSWDRSA